MDLSTATGVFLGLLSLFSPTAAIGPIAAFAENAQDDQRRRLAWRVALLYLSILVPSLWLGHFALSFLGISTSALTATGGIALFVSGFPLMTRGSKAEGARDQEKGSVPAVDLDRLSFVPITFPITIGGATVAYAIALSGRYATPLDLVAITGIAAIVAAIVYATVRLTGAVARMSAGAMDVLTRFSGIILVSLSMQFFVAGIGQLFAAGAPLHALP
jgi:multiple antibiotic resistance protein